MRFLFGILVLLPLLVSGQQNLVPNGGFEELTACPYGGDVIELAIPWTKAGGGGSPDLFSPCATDVSWGVPKNLRGIQLPRTGEVYAGVFTYNGPYTSSSELREYIQVRLSQPLEVDVEYHVSFYVSLADTFNYAVVNIGAYFSDSLIVRNNYAALNVQPQVEWFGNPIADKLNWTLVEGFYTPRFDGEEYLLVGNFRSDNESTIVLIDSTGGFTGDKSHYYIDDVSVVALDTISGIEEAEQLQFSLYPNPAVEMVNIKVKERLHHVQLFDIRGRQVIAEEANGQKHTLDLQGIPEGIYLLRVTCDDGRAATQRLVKTTEP